MKRRLLRWLWKLGIIECEGCRAWGTWCFHGSDSFPCPLAPYLEETS